VAVSGGLFTVKLNFGSGVLTGDARWLEIGVRPGDSGGAYTPLDPRQELTPSPYALALPGLWTNRTPPAPTSSAATAATGRRPGCMVRPIGGEGTAVP